MTRDRLPTPDDERNYDEQRAERNELAALVKEVREHKRTEWRTVDASERCSRGSGSSTRLDSTSMSVCIDPSFERSARSWTI